MNISPINCAFRPKVNNKDNNKTRYAAYDKTLKYDSVSFSGKKKPLQNNFSENVLSGLSLGKKILKQFRDSEFSYADLGEMVNRTSPVPVEIKSLDECPVKNMCVGAAIAHMMPLYGYDYKLKMANIYLGNMPFVAKEKTDFVANLAHEYTHVLQRAQDDDYYGILKYTQDPNEVTIIARMAKQAMDEMTRICQEELFSNQMQVNRVLSSIMDGKFDIKKSVDNSDFENIISTIAEIISVNLGKNKADMENAIKGWIKKEAQNEVEAYTVSTEVLNSSKFDPITRAKRILNKEVYSFIDSSLK